VKRKKLIQEREYWRNRCFNAEQVLIDHNSYWDTLDMDHKICTNAIDLHINELVELLKGETD
jgi:hypothetical protein